MWFILIFQYEKDIYNYCNKPVCDIQTAKIITYVNKSWQFIHIFYQFKHDPQQASCCAKTIVVFERKKILNCLYWIHHPVLNNSTYINNTSSASLINLFKFVVLFRRKFSYSFVPIVCLNYIYKYSLTVFRKCFKFNSSTTIVYLSYISCCQCSFIQV